LIRLTKGFLWQPSYRVGEMGHICVLTPMSILCILDFYG
jgi:hypothetical protein